MKCKSLSDEGIKMMLNNNNEQESQDEEQMNGMDEYGSKVLTSELTLEQVHIIIVA